MPEETENLTENNLMVNNTPQNTPTNSNYVNNIYGSTTPTNQVLQEYHEDIVTPNQTLRQKLLTYTSVGLGIVGAFGAGGTTWLLHDARRISQSWNIGNAVLRAVLGTGFTVWSSVSFSKKLSSAVWKIVSNGSYIVTTLDVNKEDTIFSNNYNYEWDQFPNPKPFIAFEISAWSGFLSGVIDLIQLFYTNENSPLNKILEKVQKVLDFVCPSAAAVGGAFLFWVKGLDSTILAPILCTADGSAGTINYLLTLFFKEREVNNHSLVAENYDTESSVCSSSIEYEQDYQEKTPLLQHSKPINIENASLVENNRVDYSTISTKEELSETEKTQKNTKVASSSRSLQMSI